MSVSPRPHEIPERILIADDDAEVRTSLRRLLTAEGYDIVEARDGLEALRQVSAGHIDLVLLDVQMPEINGIEACRRIRRELGELVLPIVFVTGSEERDTRRQGKDAGADDFINKPADPIELLARVKNLLLVKRYHDHLRRDRALLEVEVADRTADLRRSIGLLRHAEQELSLSRAETIHRLARAAEFRDSNTGDHVQRMSRYAALMARELGWPEPECETFRLAASLHDVGKIGIPDAILLKPGPLDPPEYEIMKRHAELGYNMLKDSESALLQMAAEVAWTHHERFDGQGYPRRLAGAQIPLTGRIAAIADVFDAITGERVYKPAVAPAAALEHMRDGRGSVFDPDLLDLFAKVFDGIRAIHREAHGGFASLAPAPAPATAPGVGAIPSPVPAIPRR